MTRDVTASLFPALLVGHGVTFLVKASRPLSRSHVPCQGVTSLVTVSRPLSRCHWHVPCHDVASRVTKSPVTPGRAAVLSTSQPSSFVTSLSRSIVMSLSHCRGQIDGPSHPRRRRPRCRAGPLQSQHRRAGAFTHHHCARSYAASAAGAALAGFRPPRAAVHYSRRGRVFIGLSRIDRRNRRRGQP